MDKKEWQRSLGLLESLLKKKKEEKHKIECDIEEISYSIECYKSKIKDIKR